MTETKDDLQVLAWRYQDSRGHFRYRGPRPGFDTEYAILKPIALTSHAAAQSRINALMDEAEATDRVLRSSVPDRHKGCASAVGAVQNYIAELEAGRRAMGELRRDTLTLPLKAIYFDQIKSGEKVFEYRLRTPYWKKRMERAPFRWIVLTKGYPPAGDSERRMKLPWRGYIEMTIKHHHFGPHPVEVFAIIVNEAPYLTEG